MKGRKKAISPTPIFEIFAFNPLNEL